MKKQELADQLRTYLSDDEIIACGPAGSNASFTDADVLQPIGPQTGLSAEASQAARQPAQVPRERAASGSRAAIAAASFLDY